jgi:hypothetical protein
VLEIVQVLNLHNLSTTPVAHIKVGILNCWWTVTELIPASAAMIFHYFEYPSSFFMLITYEMKRGRVG